MRNNDSDTSNLVIKLVETEAEFKIIQELVREYQNSLPFIIDWEQFEDELSQIGAKYSDPEGLFLLALKGNMPVGCVGLRQLSKRICELKRMYVLPEKRGKGIGRRLLQDIIEMAKSRKYEFMRLDTTTDLKTAISLYRTFGFYEITAYNSNPLPNVLFFELKL